MITEEQFQDICVRLEKWRKDRGLSIEDQQKGFATNFAEEINEAQKAFKQAKETLHTNFLHTDLIRYMNDYVDGLCDASVVAINAGCSLDTKIQVSPTKDTITIRDLLLITEKMGFDSYKCMKEVCEYISKRTGKWDEETKKWIKDDTKITPPNFFNCVKPVKD